MNSRTIGDSKKFGPSQDLAPLLSIDKLVKTGGKPRDNNEKAVDAEVKEIFQKS